MKTHEWHGLLDKSDWPEGVWKQEPDKAQWQDEATGLACMIRRNPAYGVWCGYVGVNSGTPLFGQDEHVVNQVAPVEVNYAAACDNDPETGICHRPESDDPEVWWFGFANLNFHDIMPANPFLYNSSLDHMEIERSHGTEVSRWTYKTADDTKRQCAELAAIIAELNTTNEGLAIIERLRH